MSDAKPKPASLTGLKAIGFVTEVFISVAVPATVFALAGRALDQRWNTSPWMTVLGFFIAISISGLLVYRKAKQMAKLLMKNETSPRGNPKT